MRRWTIAAAAALGVMACGSQARQLDQAVEPALMFKLDFGGRSAPAPGLALRLNYSADIRQTLGLRLAQTDNLQQRMQVSGQSHLFSLPAVAQFDFDRHGFSGASSLGLPLITRQLRLNQTEEAAAAESSSWFDFDFGEQNWTAWAMAGAGVIGIYLLTDDDDGDSDPVGGGGGGGTPPPEEPTEEEECTIPGGPLGCIF